MEKDISIGAIVFKRDPELKFLILKRRDNQIWDFAKGHGHNEEKELDTLRRELKEELGITDFSIVPNFKSEISYVSSRGVLRMMIFYLVSTKEEIRISGEHSEFKWIGIPEVSSYFKYADVKELLLKCEKTLNEY